MTSKPVLCVASRETGGSLRTERKWLAVLGGTIALLLVAGVAVAAAPPRDAVNLVPAYGSPPSATQPPSGAAVARVDSTVPVPAGPAVKAGVAIVDATWHVGSGAGQYADTTYNTDDPTDTHFIGDHGENPNVMSTLQVPSHGIQSRDDVRALVVQGLDGTRFAWVKNDLYIPQDLLDQRVSTILKDRDRQIAAGLRQGTPTRINDTNMMIAVTHSHSSPYYSTPSWGVWTFQDVFDLRFFEFMAQRMADAVVAASDHMVPARMGAETVPYDFTQRHSFGPAVGDDGTPAGYPQRDNDLTISVLRFDDISDRAHPRPLANFMTLGQHPEMLEGNNIITGEYIASVERMTDLGTGAVTVFSQNDTGSTEPDRECQSHACAVRAEFSHKEYAQAERGARQIANAVIRASNEIGTNHPSVPQAYVPYRIDFPVKVENRQFAPPYSHPYPSVSNCRTHEAFNGDPGIPIVGLPDCDRSAGALFGPMVGKTKGTPLDPGVTYDKLRAAGIPLPENYGAPSYTGLEETFQVHLQAFRLGEVLVTVCPCEQWADQSRDIKSRADKVQGNIWLGWDWTTYCKPAEGGMWTCPDPEKVGNWDGDPSKPPPGGTLTISDQQKRMVHAQVTNDAAGWDSIDHAATAESEPLDPAKIKGNYTHTELAPQYGYDLVVPVGMANDYWGYIATYREYQRGDHYRKALTGLGAHSSDWLATRLVAMGGALKGDPASTAKIQYNPLDLAYMVDGANQEARAELLGHDAQVYLAAYDRVIPADGGTPGPVKQPTDITRFDAAQFTWVGGDNYTDSPQVTVERQEGGQWVTAGDMTGDVPVMLDFPDQPELHNYATGSYQWKWTADFEAFDSDIDTGRGFATPAGTYRFVVHGLHRQGTPPSAQPYTVVSNPFAVKPWDGISVPDIRLERDHRVSFAVGPTNTKQFFTSYPAHPGDKTVTATAGPIDYPDTWAAAKLPTFPETGSRIFPRLERTLMDQGQRWCFSCTFRPWLDTGQAATALVQVRGPGSKVGTVAASLGPDGRWHTTVRLRPGQFAQVMVAGVHDRFGELNGTPSGIVGLPASRTSSRASRARGTRHSTAHHRARTALPRTELAAFWRRTPWPMVAFAALLLAAGGVRAVRARRRRVLLHS